MYDTDHQRRVEPVGVNPEVGLSQPLGDWFVEGTAGVWLFTDNPDFYGGTQRKVRIHCRHSNCMVATRGSPGCGWQPM